MIAQTIPPRLPQCWSEQWPIGGSVVVESGSRRQLSESAYALRNSRGPEIWFTTEPLGEQSGKTLWQLTRVEDKNTVTRLQKEIDRRARMQRMIGSQPEQSFSSISEVPHSRWSQYGGAALMYQLIQPRDVVWCPGVDAQTMQDRFCAVRQRFRRDLNKKYAYFEPAVWWTANSTGTPEPKPACWVIGVNNSAESQQMVERWKDESELYNSASQLFGVESLVPV